MQKSNSLGNAVIYEAHVRNYSPEGTFDALSQDLKRIKELGTAILWLMPIHPLGKKQRKGSLGSPYAISDYFSISPDLGDEASLLRLIGQCHQLNMKVMLDVVFNHTSTDALLVSAHPEYFFKNSAGALTRKVDDWTDVYDLDFNNRELWEYLIESLEK